MVQSSFSLFIEESDFSGLTATLSFQAQSTQCRNISVLVDVLVEETETFQVLISSSDDAVVIMEDTAIIMIADSTSECTHATIRVHKEKNHYS